MRETLRAIAHPWLCDVNVHLNTRHYQGFFDDAMMQLLAVCGFDAADGRAAGLGVVDVKCVMEYKSEVLPGAPIVVRSAFHRFGNKSFVTFHEMRSVAGEELRATCETTSLFFDLSARAGKEVPSEFRRAAEPYLVAERPTAR